MDFLALSYLNQLLYCERRFWLMYVEGEFAVNAAVLEGTLQHEAVHTTGESLRGEVVTHRQVYVWSTRLRLAGLADVVEEREGELKPIEYKHGKMGKWVNDQVQLCAQAMCLEERTGVTIPLGQIFYQGNRRRETVLFTAELRERTVATVARAFELLEAGVLPPPIDHKAKCRDCSLQPICLPDEIRQLKGR